VTWPEVVEATRRIASASLGIEIWAAEGSQPKAEDLDGLRNAAQDAPFAAVHARRALWFWDPDGLEREIAFAEAIGARTLVLHPGSLGLEDVTSSPDLPAIRRLVRQAEEAGVALALENTPGTLWALDRAPKGVGVCLDLGHLHLAEIPGSGVVSSAIGRFSDRLTHLHVHDNRGQEDDHLIPGGGSIDWQGVLAALAQARYAGPAVLELHAEGDPLLACERARRFLALL
jgi:sugar phosphate isomerase/epimerase